MLVTVPLSNVGVVIGTVDQSVWHDQLIRYTASCQWWQTCRPRPLSQQTSQPASNQLTLKPRKRQNSVDSIKRSKARNWKQNELLASNSRKAHVTRHSIGHATWAINVQRAKKQNIW